MVQLVTAPRQPRLDHDVELPLDRAELVSPTSVGDKPATWRRTRCGVSCAGSTVMNTGCTRRASGSERSSAPAISVRVRGQRST